MRKFIDTVRPWAGPILMVGLFLVLLPGAAYADTDILDTATNKVQKAITVAGWIMALAGVVIGIKSAFSISEQRGGWAGVGIAILFVLLGIKIGMSQGGQDVASIFGG